MYISYLQIFILAFDHVYLLFVVLNSHRLKPIHTNIKVLNTLLLLLLAGDVCVLCSLYLVIGRYNII